MAVNVSGLRRNLKNIAHNYSDAQVKVREATSNDPWGPTTTLMAEIADMTHNVLAFTEIMTMIWKRLNDHGKNWRHVFKAMVLLEYLIKTGSEKVAQQCKENIFKIQTLREFQYFEENKDCGKSIREKSKELVRLLTDSDLLKAERDRAITAKERLHHSGFGSDTNGYYSPTSPTSPPGFPPSSGFGGSTGALGGLSTGASSSGGRPLSLELETSRPQTAGEEELQLQLAIAMSKEEAMNEELKRKSDDVRLAMAITESAKDTPATGLSGKVAGSAQQLFHHPPPHGLSSNPNAAAQSKSTGALDILDLQDPWAAANDSQGATGFSGVDASPNVVDPWGLPSSAPATAKIETHAQPDPWSPVNSPVQVAPPAQDPWAPQTSVPVHAPVSASSSDPWSPVVESSPSSKANSSLDDPLAFASELRSSNTAPGNLLLPTSTGPSQDPFDLGLMGASLNGGTSSSKRIKPEEFLGSNAGLVNLDNLVAPTKPTTNASDPSLFTLMEKKQYGMASGPVSPPFGFASPPVFSPTNPWAQHSPLAATTYSPPQPPPPQFSGGNPFALAVATQPVAQPNPFGVTQPKPLTLEQMRSQTSGDSWKGSIGAATPLVPLSSHSNLTDPGNPFS